MKVPCHCCQVEDELCPRVNDPKNLVDCDDCGEWFCTKCIDTHYCEYAPENRGELVP